MEFRQQKIFYVLRCTHLTELPAERYHHHMIHAEFFQQLQFFLDGAQAEQGLFRPDDVAGMRVKGDDDALTLQGTGILHNAFDDGLVSVMHTIESADGDDGIPKIWQMVQAAVYLHVGQN